MAGISIDNPKIFAYGGKWYFFDINISNPSIGIQNLSNKYIELFEYTNEINSLCLYGNIIYTDIDGSISKFINRVDNLISVNCTQMEKKQDGGNLEIFQKIKRENDEDTFFHLFIVQNIGILSREKQAITYQISLISTSWYLFSSKLDFSNYPIDTKVFDEASKPRNGYLILLKLLSESISKSKSFKIHVDTFQKLAEKSSNKVIPFITNCNDNMFSVMKYIFDRMYWNKFRTEESLKYIAYSPAQSLYRCIDYGDEKTFFTCARPYILLSMFETNFEQQIFSSNAQLASMVGKNQTSTYENLFKHTIWEYDSSTNTFNTFNSFDSIMISNLYNNKPNLFKEIDKVKTEQKYSSVPRPEYFINNDYSNQMTEWNRKSSIYWNLIDNLTKRDAIVINTEGDISHQPGACMTIVLDRTMEKLTEMNNAQLKELYEKHRQLEMIFPILKVQHRYHIANTKSESSYTENVVLGRNFILPSKK